MEYLKRIFHVGPPRCSTACEGCVYGREEHSDDCSVVKAAFDALNARLVAEGEDGGSDWDGRDPAEVR